MKLIPGQTFIMGDGNGREDQRPAHPVTLDAFYISPYMITVQEFCDFLNEAVPTEIRDCKVYRRESGEVMMDLTGEAIAMEGDKFVPRPGEERWPMTYITWKAAALYCNWLSEKEGLVPCYRMQGKHWGGDLTTGGYHLPTEAQFECAARGGLKGKRFPWGDTIDPKLANYGGNVGHPTDVGSYPPNAYGLYDMTGNVMEWCDDWYIYDRYAAAGSGERNPTTPMPYIENESRVFRGGSFLHPADYLACSARYGSQDNKGFTGPTGFRVVRDARVPADASAEARTAQDWLGKFLSGKAEDAPISLSLGGKPASLKSWKVGVGGETALEGKKTRTVTLADPKTKLEIACEIITFDNFPAVDWLLRVTNRGSADTPIIEDLKVMDWKFTKASGDNREFILRHSSGSRFSNEDFLPVEDALMPGEGIVLGGQAGRSSMDNLPFMNLSCGRGGVVMGVGWTGQWETSFKRDKGSGLSVQAGMEYMRLKLHPGESIRSPRMLLVFWDGEDMIRGHNLFRKLILAHYNPRIDGKLVIPPIAAGTANLNDYTEQNQIEPLPTLKEAGVEVLWIDAGWFVGGWPDGTGNWFPKPENFPNGLGPVGDAVHKAGMKFLVWFEPERVAMGTAVAKEHPEWVIGPITQTGGLFNWGIPEARQYMTDLISRQIEEGHIDIFRNDFNMEPLYYWRKADAPDRLGMTEIRFVEGLYKMWDDLRVKHPGLWIDNCASGGRMIDLETTMRSIPLWQSDTQCFPGWPPMTGQLQNGGLNLYIPMHCGGVVGIEPSYEFRSSMMTGGPGPISRENTDAYLLARPYFEGDFYPLYDEKSDENIWWAYQLDRPDLGKGMVMVFRRPGSMKIEGYLRLEGLDPKADYELTDKDSGDTRLIKGAELMPLYVKIEEKPGSRVLFYRKVK